MSFAPQPWSAWLIQITLSSGVAAFFVWLFKTRIQVEFDRKLAKLKSELAISEHVETSLYDRRVQAVDELEQLMRRMPKLAQEIENVARKPYTRKDYFDASGKFMDGWMTVQDCYSTQKKYLGDEIDTMYHRWTGLLGEAVLYSSYACVNPTDIIRSTDPQKIAAYEDWTKRMKEWGEPQMKRVKSAMYDLLEEFQRAFAGIVANKG